MEVGRDGRRIYAWTGHAHSVFRIVGDRLYYADFKPNGSGGGIVAVDLKAEKQLWRSPLKALGAVSHSGYRNMINLDVSKDAVIVFGWESSGRYLELKSLEDGASVAHRLFAEKELKEDRKTEKESVSELRDQDR
jgi:hypothetical protein